MKKDAIREVIGRGARGETVRVVSVEVVPLEYVVNGEMRVSVRVVGDVGGLSIGEDGDLEEEEEEEEGGEGGEGGFDVQMEGEQPERGGEEEVDYENYIPKVIGDEWTLSETDLRKLVSLSNISYSSPFSIHNGRMRSPRNRKSNQSYTISHSDGYIL